uniref:Uncharacterized protein n=1 Tax=Toxoplasma gondii COUG TaxID=1074873 RepID=A0A2G8YA40_TOXGO|nr:hypothetical protein TGCOUG_391780 [Toxoplasma gondii COUG]
MSPKDSVKTHFFRDSESLVHLPVVQLRGLDVLGRLQREPPAGAAALPALEAAGPWLAKAAKPEGEAPVEPKPVPGAVEAPKPEKEETADEGNAPPAGNAEGAAAAPDAPAGVKENGEDAKEDDEDANEDDEEGNEDDEEGNEDDEDAKEDDEDANEDDEEENEEEKKPEPVEFCAAKAAKPPPVGAVTVENAAKPPPRKTKSRKR